MLILGLVSMSGVASAAAPGVSPDTCDAAPDAPVAVVDPTCVESSDPSFTPEVSWTWAGSTTYSGYNNVLSSPAVGDISGDGVPDIVITAYASSYTAAGILVALDGADGSVLWETDNVGGYKISPAVGTAIADIDDDGTPDVCFAGDSTTDGLVCATNTGALKWHYTNGSSFRYLHPSIADMNGDGKAEIAIGNVLLDHAGTKLATLSSAYIPVFVDWDGDGDMEVVTAGGVVGRTGTVEELITLTGGYFAVGDVDGDGKVDLASVRAAVGLTVYANDGSILWTKVDPDLTGGAPMIEDLDGDGSVEVVYASRSGIYTYDSAGNLLWSKVLDDSSSGILSPTAFDFDGDGNIEVVIADQETLYILDGATGVELGTETGHSSTTLWEMAVVADVDGDGASDIVLAENSSAASPNGRDGVTVLRSADGAWKPSREVWNQHAYSRVNINEDLSLPTPAEASWATYNSFRSAGASTGGGGTSDMVDLSIGTTELCYGECDLETLQTTVWVPVLNEGTADATAVTLSFVRADASVAESVDVGALASGASAVYGPFDFSEADWGTGALTVTVSTDAVGDCDTTNDAADLGDWSYPSLDGDGDGYDDAVCGADDCEDADAGINPGAAEICNGIDDNCDGAIDDTDADGDGYTDCDDCDDSNPDVNPGAAEVCNGIDDNCDGAIDDTDADGDGYTDCDDCDDSNPDVSPGAAEVCNDVDDDCSGLVDDIDADGDGAYDEDCPTVPPEGPLDCDDSDATIQVDCPTCVDADGDSDGDGYDACSECDDTNAAVNPGATEVCNGIDDDCDGIVDNVDADGDGYIDEDCTTGPPEGPWDCDDTDPTIFVDCPEPCVDADGDTDGDGYDACNECDDADAAVNPDAIEVCNEIDDDCDGIIDNVDADADGYIDEDCTTGPPEGPWDCDDADPTIFEDCPVCVDADGDGYTDCDECDDTNPDVNPGAAEICNEIDDDCDGIVDNVDADADGYVDEDCTTGPPEGPWDCDDTDPTIFEDCEICVDEDGDSDGDGFDACSDCDDANAAVNPDAVEICNELDDDCDGIIDNVDADGDGYIDEDCTTGPTEGPWDCDDADPAIFEDCDICVDADGDGYTNCDECDDTNAAVNPGATEICNGVDDDCNDIIDDVDADEDGAYDEECDTIPSEGPFDCDDSDATVQDECCVDDDGDGYDDCTECDDTDADVNPGAVEVCNGLDDDCNDVIDDVDADGDGAFDDECDDAPGPSDCDDSDPALQANCEEEPVEGKNYYEGGCADGCATAAERPNFALGALVLAAGLVSARRRRL